MSSESLPAPVSTPIPKVTVWKAISHFWTSYHEAMATNPYGLPGWQVLGLQTLIIAYVLGSTVHGYVQTVRHNDVWYLIMGFLQGCPALAAFVWSMFPPVLAKF
jgi:hypothetical protein